MKQNRNLDPNPRGGFVQTLATIYVVAYFAVVGFALITGVVSLIR